MLYTPRMSTPTLKTYVWLYNFDADNTVCYFFANAETVEKAREIIIEKAKLIKDTTNECVFNSEGVEYRYKSTPMGSKDGILHLSAPHCMTTEEVCYRSKEVEAAVSEEPLFVAPINCAGFVTAVKKASPY